MKISARKYYFFVNLYWPKDILQEYCCFDTISEANTCNDFVSINGTQWWILWKLNKFSELRMSNPDFSKSQFFLFLVFWGFFFFLLHICKRLFLNDIQQIGVMFFCYYLFGMYIRWFNGIRVGIWIWHNTQETTWPTQETAWPT